MRKYLLAGACALLGLAVAAQGQQTASVTIEGQTFTIKLAAPAAKDRASGSFHADADVVFTGFNVPKGDYTVYILASGGEWQLAVNKVTGAAAAAYNPKLDVGRVPMKMSKSPTPSAACKITVTKVAALAARIEVAWNDAVATTQFYIDRHGSDSEW
jgi:hypothetical protein